MSICNQKRFECHYAAKNGACTSTGCVKIGPGAGYGGLCVEGLTPQVLNVDGIQIRTMPGKNAVKAVDDLLRALRRLKVETGSLACFGCGRERNCGIHGCAILRDAIALIEELTENRSSIMMPKEDV